MDSLNSINYDNDENDYLPPDQIPVFWEDSVVEKVQFFSAMEKAKNGRIPKSLQGLTEPHRSALLKALVSQLSLAEVIGSLPNYDLTEDSRFEVVTLIVDKTVVKKISQVIERIFTFNLSEPHRLEVFKQVIERRMPSIPFQDIQNYDLSAPSYIEAVKFVAPFTNVDHIRSELGELKESCERSEAMATRNLHNILNTELPAETHFEVAKILAAYNSKGVLKNIKQFQLSDVEKAQVENL